MIHRTRSSSSESLSSSDSNKKLDVFLELKNKKMSSSNNTPKSKLLSKLKSKKKEGAKASGKDSGKSKVFHGEDSRFTMMHSDPKFLPVESKTLVNDPRLYEILDPSFTMLKKSRDASSRFSEQALKNTLKDIYNFEKDPMAMRVAKLKQAKKEMEEEEGRMDEESDYDSDDSIEGAREMLGKKSDRKPLTKDDIFEGDEEEEDEEEENMDYDKFLESLEGRPELENVEWDEKWEDAYDFDDEDAGILRAVGKTTEEEPEFEEQDLWDKYVDDDKEVKMIEDGDETRRFAVTNCDWSLVDSTDLFVLFSSMCPSSGRVISVTVYLSDYGKEQMRFESVHGPGNLFMDEETKRKY